MTVRYLPGARPEPRRPLPSEGITAAVDDDQTQWLVTFSDLVLQLFAFVLVSLMLGKARAGAPLVVAPAAPPPVAAAAVRTAPEEARVPTGRETAVDSRTDRAALAAGASPVETPPVVASAPAVEVAPAAAVPGAGTDELAERALATRLAAVGRSLQSFVDAAGMADAATVAVTDSAVVLSISDTIGFASGSAELLPAALSVLQEVRTLAGSMPDFGIDVAGHTDDVPIHTTQFPSNLELSLARAARVAREIAAGDPDLAMRTVAAGFGEHRPVATNADPEGRARNRRVELRLVPIDHSTP